MNDCDEQPLGERISRALIPVGCALMSFLRRMRRPGANVAALLIFALGAIGVAKEYDWPHESWWKPGSAGLVSFIVLSILTGAASLFVVIGFRRLLTKKSSLEQFEKAAHDLSRLVEDQTSLRLRRNEIGINIWLVKGMWGFRRLVRGAQVVAVPRRETPITWTKAKGIIGEAWARKTSRFADLDLVRSVVPTQAEWCSLPRDLRFHLSWSEFEETRRYHAVLAVPLRRHRFARHSVRGVIAIDVLISGRGHEINGIQETAEFSSIVRTCEAAFAPRD